MRGRSGSFSDARIEERILRIPGARGCCEAGECVAASLCPPSGPYGTNVADTLGDWSLMDCDGVEHVFHDLCELRAVHIFAFAGW